MRVSAVKSIVFLSNWRTRQASIVNNEDLYFAVFKLGLVVGLMMRMAVETHSPVKSQNLMPLSQRHRRYLATGCDEAEGGLA